CRASEWQSQNGTVTHWLLSHALVADLPRHLLRIESITDPWLGENVTRVRRIRLDLLSQLPNEDAQILSLFSVITAPNSTEQRMVSQDLVCVPDKVSHQFKFLGRQAELLSTLGRGMGSEIDAKITSFENLSI